MVRPCPSRLGRRQLSNRKKGPLAAQHCDVVELVWCANGERSLYRPQAVQPVQARFPRHFAAHPAQDARRAVGQATERPSMRSRARSRASSFVKVPVLVL